MKLLPNWIIGGGWRGLDFRESLARALLDPVTDTAKHPNHPSSSEVTPSILRLPARSTDMWLCLDPGIRVVETPSFCQNILTFWPVLVSTLHCIKTVSPSFTFLSTGVMENTGGIVMLRKAETELSPAMFSAWQTYFPDSASLTFLILNTAASSSAAET